MALLWDVSRTRPRGRSVRGIDMRVTARVRGKLQNLKNLEKTYKKLVAESKVECAVGYPVNASGLGTPEAAYDDRASVIQVALWNNYGTDKTPARPFMDLAAREMGELYKKGMKTLGPKIARGEARVEKVLDVLGLQAEECVRKAIMDGEWAPNAPETIKRKKSERPLVDTGTMRNRVTHVVRAKTK